MQAISSKRVTKYNDLTVELSYLLVLIMKMGVAGSVFQLPVIISDWCIINKRFTLMVVDYVNTLVEVN